MTNPVMYNGIYGGMFSKVPNNKPYQIYSVSKEKDQDKIIFIINLSGEPAEFKLSGIDGEYQNCLLEDKITISRDTMLSLEGWDYLILKR